MVPWCVLVWISVWLGPSLRRCRRGVFAPNCLRRRLLRPGRYPRCSSLFRRRHRARGGTNPLRVPPYQVCCPFPVPPYLLSSTLGSAFAPPQRHQPFEPARPCTLQRRSPEFCPPSGYPGSLAEALWLLRAHLTPSTALAAPWVSPLMPPISSPGSSGLQHLAQTLEGLPGSSHWLPTRSDRHNLRRLTSHGLSCCMPGHPATVPTPVRAFALRSEFCVPAFRTPLHSDALPFR